MKKHNNAKNNGLKGWAIICLCSLLVNVFFLLGIFCYFFYPKDQRREIVTIPSFIGMTEDQILKDARFNIEKEWVYSSEDEKGLVVSQEPYAKSRRKLGRGEQYTVRLTISLGEKTNLVPPLAGRTSEVAAAILRELGVHVRSVNVFDSEYDNDVVISTSPNEKEKITDGQTVTLFVSKKRATGSVRVGSFIGKNQDEACREALFDGLFIGEISTEASEMPQGQVIWQSLAEGAYVLSGTHIDFIISGGTSDGESDRDDGHVEHITEEITKTKPKRKFRFWGFW